MSDDEGIEMHPPDSKMRVHLYFVYTVLYTVYEHARAHTFTK